MNKIKQILPVILALLEKSRPLVKSIAESIVQSGGLGFRRRIKQFVEETNQVIKSQDESIEKLARAAAEDAEAYEARFKKLQKQVSQLEEKLKEKNEG